MEYYCCELNHSKYCPEVNGGKCWVRILEERDPKEYRPEKERVTGRLITIEESVEVLERLRGHVDETTLNVCIRAIERSTHLRNGEVMWKPLEKDDWYLRVVKKRGPRKN